MAEPVRSSSSLDPVEVEHREFSRVRRGYEPAEVRGVLVQVAADLRRLHTENQRLIARVNDLSRQVADNAATRQSAPPAAPPQIDEQTVAEMLGHETVQVLTAAREAAADIRANAAKAAEQLIAEAEAETERQRDEIRVQAALEADEIRTASEKEAEATRAAAAAELEVAKQRGREMLGEARDFREKVLRDLAMRRKVARKQLEGMKAAQERLRDAFATCHNAVEAVTTELDLALPEARVAADRASRSVTDDIERVVDEFEAAITTGELPAITVERVTPRTSAALPVSSRAVAPFAAARSVPSAPADGEQPALAETAPADAESAETADAAPADTGPADRSTADVDAATTTSAAATATTTPTTADHEADAPGATGVGSEDVTAEEVTLGEVASEVVAPEVVAPEAVSGVERPFEERLAGETGSDGEVVESAETESTAAESGEVASTDSTPAPAEPSEAAAGDGADNRDGVRRHLRVVGAAGLQETERVDALFARLRNDSALRSQAVHPEAGAPVPAGAASGQNGSQPAGSPDPGSPDSGGGRLATLSALPVASLVDADPGLCLARRDEQLRPLLKGASRRVKRVLADEENEVLDALRRLRKRPAVELVLLDLADHVDRYCRALQDELVAAGRAGIELGADLVGDAADSFAEPSNRDLDLVLADAFVMPLRERVTLAFGDTDPEVIGERIRSAYRWARTDAIDEIAEGMLIAAFNRGSATVTTDVERIPADRGRCHHERATMTRAAFVGSGWDRASVRDGCRCLAVPSV